MRRKTRRDIFTLSLAVFCSCIGTLKADSLWKRKSPQRAYLCQDSRARNVGDLVTIATPALGALTNIVRLATECPEWTFGTAALMRNLAARGLL